MKLRDKLRQVPVARVPSVPGSRWVQAETGRRYLVIELENDLYERASGWVDVDGWLEQEHGPLAGVAWEAVPLHYLARWLREKCRFFYVDDVVWRVSALTRPEGPLPERLAAVPAMPCPVLCQAWPDMYNGHALPVSLIPFTLECMLGYTYLPIREMSGVGVGDLIGIENIAPVLSVSSRPLFHFSINKEMEVYVDKPFYADPEDDIPDEAEEVFEWETLPVKVEFLLGRPRLMLGSIQDMQPGTRIDLGPEAEKKVEILLNRKLFGYGELVAIEDGRLAVEVNALLPGAGKDPEHMDDGYAE